MNIKRSIINFLFFRKLPDGVTKDIVNNYPGIPPDDLSWDDAVKNIHPLISSFPILEKCPICGGDLIQHQSDFWATIEQYMVQGYYCPSGRFTILEYA